jgi:hypothetical protein
VSEGIGVAVIGLGESFRRIHRPTIAALPMLKLLHVCDRDTDHARRIAAELGVRASDTAQILADDRVSGVVICTPPLAHLELSVAAVSAGKWVLCEKPFGFHELPDALSERWWPFLPYADSPLIRPLLGSRGATAMTAVMGHSGIEESWHPRSGNWYVDPAIAGAGVGHDLGSHLLPLLPLLGLELSMLAPQATAAADIDSEVLFTDGTNALLLSWRLPVPSEMISIVDGAGAISIDFRASLAVGAGGVRAAPQASLATSGYLGWLQALLGRPDAVAWAARKVEAVREVRQWQLKTGVFATAGRGER